jgi:hypothetical protein
MFHIPKKLLAVAAPVAIVVALALPSMAFAGTASESLPNTESGNWTGVTTECNGEPTPVAGCPFVATSTHSVLTNGGLKFANCNVVLNGKIFRDGSSQITSGTVEGNAICRQIKIKAETPWANQICEYTGSSPHSYYDRISISFFEAGGEKISGPIFVHLLNSEGKDASPLTVKFASAQKFGAPTVAAEIGKGPWGILADGEKESTRYEFSNEAVKVTSTAAACPWNFAKLNELP